MQLHERSTILIVPGLRGHVPDHWSQLVGTLLLQSEDCRPTLQQVASAVHISPRTLNRYLAREGTNFRTLALRIRNRRACELLAEGKLSVSDIAYALGYTDIGNFSRSFKRASGVAPSAYREAMRACAPSQ